MRYYIHPQNQYGSIDEYFHFLYGYLFPFIQHTSPSYDDIYFLLDCNGFSRFYKELKAYKINTIEKNKNLAYNIDMLKSYIGFDSIRCIYENLKPDIIKERIYKSIKYTQNKYNTDVLLINRAIPNLDDKQTFSGSIRRSIPNIDSIRNLLDRKNVSYTFCHMENMTLKEQIEIFSSHKIIIAQHGAALSNIIFCDNVIDIYEIRPLEKNNEPWYENLSKILGKRLISIPQDHSHAPVNVQHLEKYI